MPRKKTTKKPRLRQEPRILALDPGLKYTGYVLLRGMRILTHGVWKLGSDPRGVRKQAAYYFQEFAPDELVLEWPSPVTSRRAGSMTKTLRGLHQVATAMRGTAQANSIPTFLYSPPSIRRIVVGDGWATKDEMAIFLSVFYPELVIYLRQDLRFKTRHWHHVFDALAAGLCHVRMEQAKVSSHAPGRRYRRSANF